MLISKKVDWTTLKNYIISTEMGLRYFEDSKKYEIYALDNFFSLICNIFKDGGEEQTDFENNFKSSSNQPANSYVTTQFEMDNKDLKLAKISGTVDPDTKQSVMYLKVPGQFGVDDGRWISGGYATSDEYDRDDYVCVYFEDKDRVIATILGQAIAESPDAEALPDEVIQSMGILPSPFNVAFPSYPIVKSYTDDELPEENQGWYFDPMTQGNGLPPVGYTDIEPIGGYGHAIAGMYLKLVWTRPNSTSGSIRISIWWGKKDL